jgi:hypothetical protein
MLRKVTLSACADEQGGFMIRFVFDKKGTPREAKSFNRTAKPRAANRQHLSS